MASFRETMRHLLLSCPSIFPSPRQVSIHLFAVIGNGYEWSKDGELIDCHDRVHASSMKFSDLEEFETQNRVNIEAEKDAPILVNLYRTRDLHYKSERMMRQFIVDNMDTILDGKCTEAFFNRGLHREWDSYVTDGICPQYARAFHFPDNIKPDWAEALNDFIDWWLVNLNQVFGLNHKDPNNISFWPENAQKGRQALLEARERLWPYAHNGQTFAEYQERSKATMARLKELWAKEDAEEQANNRNS